MARCFIKKSKSVARKSLVRASTDESMRRWRRTRGSSSSSSSDAVVAFLTVLLAAVVVVTMTAPPPASFFLRKAAATTVHAYSTAPSTPGGQRRIAVVGGGASGIFAAIHAAGARQQQQQQQQRQNVDVTVLEAGRKTLTKVAISGGGRCNVLPDVRKDASVLLEGYPRGHRELRGIFTRHFPAPRAARWFERHGVSLKTEADGRMFPVTDSSRTVTDALLRAAEDARVEIRTGAKVESIRTVTATATNDDDDDHPKAAPPPSFRIRYSEKAKDGTKKERDERFDAVILATGSAPAGYALVKDLLASSYDTDNGNDNDNNKHKQQQQQPFFVDPMPSLFTLSTKLDITDERTGLLHGLSGVSVPKARVAYRLSELGTPDNNKPNDDKDQTKKKKRKKKAKWIQQEGPLLITHSGLSGPAALRLSAHGAREIGQRQYRGDLRIHWAPDHGNAPDIFEQLWENTVRHPQRSVASVCPLLLMKDAATAVDTVDNEPAEETSSATANNNPRQRQTAIPKRLWTRLVTVTAGLDKTLTWAGASKEAVRRLAAAVAECPLRLTGKGRFKEEFVTAGGVALNCIDMTTMQSKSCPGLFFCGELINVDGVTGGYNFANCWSTGYVAGTSAAAYVQELRGSVKEKMHC